MNWIVVLKIQKIPRRGQGAYEGVLEAIRSRRSSQPEGFGILRRRLLIVMHDGLTLRHFSHELHLMQAREKFGAE